MHNIGTWFVPTLRPEDSTGRPVGELTIGALYPELFFLPRRSARVSLLVGFLTI